MNAAPAASAFYVPEGFSFFEGGALSRVWQRSRWIERVSRIDTRVPVFSIAAVVAMGWLVPLLLATAEGRAWSGAAIPFSADIETHLRFLVAAPLLLTGSRLADRVLPGIFETLVAKGIVREKDRARLAEIVADAARWNRAPWIPALVLAAIALAGRSIWEQRFIGQPAAWYGVHVDHATLFTHAGLWYALVSIPIFQFLVFRWYVRLLLWWVVLWRISRLDLELLATDPDCAGGLGFIAARVYAFLPFVIGQGVVVAGTLADHIFHAGRRLPEYKTELIGAMTLVFVAVLGPMTPFARPLVVAKRRERGEFSAFATRYAGAFERKWLRRGGTPEEPLLGSPDIQSLADLANAASSVRRMRPIPFDRGTITKVVAAFLLPIAPLLLTEVPIDKLVEAALKLVI